MLTANRPGTPRMVLVTEAAMAEASTTPCGTPITTPNSARHRAARRNTPAIWRRRPSIAFMTPISAVCSAMSVFIVLAIRNTEVTRARPART